MGLSVTPILVTIDSLVLSITTTFFIQALNFEFEFFYMQVSLFGYLRYKGTQPAMHKLMHMYVRQTSLNDLSNNPSCAISLFLALQTCQGLN